MCWFLLPPPGSALSRVRVCADRAARAPGIKEYSDWPTVPQLYVNREFVGGCDILVSMHKDGSLASMLEEKDVLVPAESNEGGEEPAKP